MGDLAVRIVQAMRAAGYQLSAEPGQVNVVYVEGMDPDGTPNANKPNEFNDSRFVIVFAGNAPTLLGAWEATTEPSLHWTKHPMNAKGAARIKFGQYKAWRVGTHNNNHEALVQRANVTVCRDLNQDFKREGDKEDTGDGFGINQHWGYDLPKGDLGTSSAGCLVGRKKAGHREFMAIVKSDPRYMADHNYLFRTAVLPAADVMAVGKSDPAPSPEPKPPVPQPPPAPQPGESGVVAVAGVVFKNIEATMFQDKQVAYQDVKSGWNYRPGVALPARFPSGPRPRVKVTNRANGKSVVCDIIDVGPHNIRDAYWLKPGSRPLVETQFAARSPAQNGKVPRNKAAIDLTPEADRAIGLDGKGIVSWEFVT